MSSFEYYGENIDLTESECRLSKVVPMTVWLLLLMAASLCATIFLYVEEYSIEKIGTAALVFVVSSAIFWSTDFAFVFENKNRCIDYSWRILGIGHRRKVCHFVEKLQKFLLNILVLC